MFPRQDDADPDEEADHKTDDETKPGRVTHRAFTQIKNSRRFIFVHGEKSAPVTVARKTGKLFPFPICRPCCLRAKDSAM